MKSGIELITEERQCQIEKEGYTVEHDDDHINGELALAARCYRFAASDIESGLSVEEVTSNYHRQWPWEVQWFKVSPDLVRNLVKSGALMLAEIERLKRNSPDRTFPIAGFEMLLSEDAANIDRLQRSQA